MNVVRWYEMVYLFDPREEEGYAFRAPRFLADLITSRRGAWLDWDTTPEGVR